MPLCCPLHGPVLRAINCSMYNWHLHATYRTNTVRLIYTYLSTEHNKEMLTGEGFNILA